MYVDLEEDQKTINKIHENQDEKEGKEEIKRLKSKIESFLQLSKAANSDQHRLDTVSMLRRMCGDLSGRQREVSARIIITPQLARKLLSINTTNRYVKASVVGKYVGEILRGEWKYTGDTIKISLRNFLIDGQHRLLAVLISEMAIEVRLVIGVDDSVFSVLDGGSNRTAGTDISQSGAAYGNVAASVAGWIIKHRIGKMVSCPSSELSRPLINKVYNENEKEIQRSIALYGSKMQSLKLMSASPAAFVHFCFSKIDQELADRFMDKLITGVDLSINDPIYRLREKLLKNMRDSQKFNAYFLIAFCFKSWNYVYRNKPLNYTISWKKGDKFPVLLGWHK